MIDSDKERARGKHEDCKT